MPDVLSDSVASAPVPISVDSNIHYKWPDEELIDLCLMKDERAWRVLLDRYGGLIYSIAWKSDLPAEDVADVFQSVCLAMVEGLKRLEDASKLSSWLATITRRHCNRIRQRQRQQWVEADQEKEELADFPDDSPTPDETIQELERARLLRQAVFMLDEPCRSLLTCLFYGQEPPSYKEIAKQLGWPVSAIGPKRGRCLKRLRRVLDQIGF